MKKSRATVNNSITLTNKLELGISIAAILNSSIALWQSLTAQSQISAPNIQLLKATINDYDLQHEPDIFLESNHHITIVGTILFKNYGNTPVQMLDIDGQSVRNAQGENNAEIQEMLLVSDHETFATDLRYMVRTLDDIRFAEQSSKGIIHRTINPKEEKTLYFLFRIVGPEVYVVDKKLLQDLVVSQFNIKIFVTFSNGQQLSIIPEYIEQ